MPDLVDYHAGACCKRNRPQVGVRDRVLVLWIRERADKPSINLHLAGSPAATRLRGLRQSGSATTKQEG